MADEGIAERLAGLVALSSGEARLDTLIRLTCGRALSLPPLPVEVDLIDGASECDSVVAAFAEQFTVDVSGVGENQRAQFVSALGTNAFRVTVAIFIADFVPRVWAGLEALGMGKPGNGGAVRWDHDTDPIEALLNDFVPAVARLRAVDPVTTEVVRLRGATQHNCRLCKSLRDSTALEAGGSESLYGEIERYESSEVCGRVDLDTVGDHVGGGGGGAGALQRGRGVRADAGCDAQREQQDRGVAGGRRAACVGGDGAVPDRRGRADGVRELASAARQRCVLCARVRSDKSATAAEGAYATIGAAKL